MKPPPFLMFATLLFWGWQADFLITGVILGAVLELPRVLKFRWDLDDADFNRIWSFCDLLFVAMTAYVMTNNNQGGLSGVLHGSHPNTDDTLSADALSSSRFLRWLPMTLYAFILAQVFNERPTVPLTAISMVLRWRRRKGERTFMGRYVDVSYPYFMACLLAAGIHPNPALRHWHYISGRPEVDRWLYFVGLVFLTFWALWANRPRRFGLYVWLAALLAAACLGIGGISGILLAQRGIIALNAEWMMRLFGGPTSPLQATTTMGRIGHLKLSDKIVIRLEPQKVGKVPEYLQEATYRSYTPREMSWYAGINPDSEALQPEVDNTTWILVTNKTDTAVVSIACYLNERSKDGDPQGVLPLPSGCSRLEKLPYPSAAYALQKSLNGVVLATGVGLMIFDARFGPGVTMDAPPDLDSTNRDDLAVPADELSAVQNVLDGLKLEGASDQEKRRAVMKFFLDNFQYSEWQSGDKRLDAQGTPLSKFLLTSRTGHCEYFASATVLLLRQLRIPARYAVGYYVHEPSGSGYVVRERDAHAWCLVWNTATKTWENFDTTPPSWVATESAHAGWDQWLSDLKSWLGYQLERFRWRQANLQQYILWALVPVMLVLLYTIIFLRRGKKRAAEANKPKDAEVWPGLDSEFYRLEQMLAARGVPRQGGEALSDWLERALAEPALASLREPIRELLRLHYQYRFDPLGLSVLERERLSREARTCLEAIAHLAK
jgi:hypothetical protein